MIDYVTFETALKLKGAGFSQPIKTNTGNVTYRNVGKRVFAPRATDIMLHLPDGCQLQMEIETHGRESKPMWYVFPPDHWGYKHNGKQVFPEGNENPAEAAAQMWLKLNQK